MNIIAALSIAELRALTAQALPLKNDKHISAYKVTLQGEDVFVKHFHPQKSSNRFKRFLGLHRSKQNHDMSKALQLAGFSTPSSYGYLINKSEPNKLESWFFAEYLATMKDLRSVFHNGDDVLPHVKVVAEVLGRFHKQGFVHGDMKWANVYVNVAQPGEYSFIDLDSCVRSRSVKKARKDFFRFMKNVYQSGMADDVIAQVVGYYCRGLSVAPERHLQAVQCKAQQELWRDLSRDKDPL